MQYVEVVPYSLRNGLSPDSTLRLSYSQQSLQSTLPSAALHQQNVCLVPADAKVTNNVDWPSLSTSSASGTVISLRGNADKEAPAHACQLLRAAGTS